MVGESLSFVLGHGKLDERFSVEARPRIRSASHFAHRLGTANAPTTGSLTHALMIVPLPLYPQRSTMQLYLARCLHPSRSYTAPPRSYRGHWLIS